MGAAETKAGHEEESVDGTSAATWPQLDGVRPKTSPALVDDRRSEEDGEGRGGAKSNIRNGYLGSKRNGNVLDNVELTLKGQRRDPYTLRAQYLENSCWRLYLATIAN